MTSEVEAAARAPQTAAPPLSLLALAIFYGGMVSIAGVLGNKQVALGPLAVEAGIFAFLLLVVTSSAVAELHGQTVAKRLVLFGFVPMIVSMILSIVVLQIPASPDMDPERLSAFDTILGGTPRIWLAGILAYGVSTFLNVTIFSRLKAREGKGLLWLRSAIASILSPDSRHVHLHHRRFLWRVPDHRADPRPDDRQGRFVGAARAALRLRFRGHRKDPRQAAVRNCCPASLTHREMPNCQRVAAW